jgi:hypothetical protein
MILIKEEIKKRIGLVFDKNYTQLFPYFVRLLRKTRLPYLKHNGFFMSALQMNMVERLFEWQKEWRKIKSSISRAESKKEKEELEERLLIYTEWIRIFQTIMDGIAWRNLKFNRPLIRLMSENIAPGHLNENDVKVFRRYLGRIPNLVIVNDLTRCLRISDFTWILPDGRVFLYEIKKSGKVLKDMGRILKETRKHKRFFSPQELRQCVVQAAIMDGKIIVPIRKNGKIKEEKKAEIISLDFPIKTHFSAIKKLIKKANKNGYTQAELEQGYFIGISAYDKMMESPDPTPYLKYRKKQFEKNVPEWLKNGKARITTICNYESFLQEGGHYTRNILPYSIVPFSAKDCVRLMMGSLYLKIYYNLDTLKEKIEKTGWIVEEKRSSDLKKKMELFEKESKEPGNFYTYNLDETLYYISKQDGDRTYYATVLYTEVMIMLSSMYKTEFLINNINSHFVNAKKHNLKGRTTATNFLYEQKILV